MRLQLPKERWAAITNLCLTILPHFTSRHCEKHLQRKAAYIRIKFPHDWNQNYVPFIRVLFIFINLWTVEEEAQESRWGDHEMDVILYYEIVKDCHWFLIEKFSSIDLQMPLPSSQKDKGGKEGGMKHIQICKSLFLWLYNETNLDFHDMGFLVWSTLNS